VFLLQSCPALALFCSAVELAAALLHLHSFPTRRSSDLAIAFAPKDALGGVFLDTPWESVSGAIHVSAYSLKAIAVAAKPVLNKGAGIVGLTFDATISWPVYDWMGVEIGRAHV